MERKANVEGERPGAPLIRAAKLSLSLHHMESRVKMVSRFCLSVGQDRRGCGESARAGPAHTGCSLHDSIIVILGCPQRTLE